METRARRRRAKSIISKCDTLIGRLRAVREPIEVESEDGRRRTRTPSPESWTGTLRSKTARTNDGTHITISAYMPVITRSIIKRGRHQTHLPHSTRRSPQHNVPILSPGSIACTPPISPRLLPSTPTTMPKKKPTMKRKPIVVPSPKNTTSTRSNILKDPLSSMPSKIQREKLSAQNTRNSRKSPPSTTPSRSQRNNHKNPSKESLRTLVNSKISPKKNNDKPEPAHINHDINTEQAKDIKSNMNRKKAIRVQEPTTILEQLIGESEGRNPVSGIANKKVHTKQLNMDAKTTTNPLLVPTESDEAFPELMERKNTMQTKRELKENETNVDVNKGRHEESESVSRNKKKKNKKKKHKKRCDRSDSQKDATPSLLVKHKVLYQAPAILQSENELKNPLVTVYALLHGLKSTLNRSYMWSERPKAELQSPNLRQLKKIGAEVDSFRFTSDKGEAPEPEAQEAKLSQYLSRMKSTRDIKKLMYGNKSVALCEFQYKAYAPKIFSWLRSQFAVSSVQFIISACFNDIVDFSFHHKENGSLAVEFGTSDGMLRIKSMTQKEHKRARELLPSYVAHIRARPYSTHLSRLFGLYRIRKGKQTSYFGIYQSPYHPATHVNAILDIQGFGDPPPRPPRKASGYVMDNQMSVRGERVDVGKRTAKEIEKTLDADLRFLESHGCVEYSLLVGISHISKQLHRPSTSDLQSRCAPFVPMLSQSLMIDMAFPKDEKERQRLVQHSEELQKQTNQPPSSLATDRSQNPPSYPGFSNEPMRRYFFTLNDIFVEKKRSPSPKQFRQQLYDYLSRLIAPQ